VEAACLPAAPEHAALADLVVALDDDADAEDAAELRVER
jgi:hypothetical protein